MGDETQYVAKTTYAKLKQNYVLSPHTHPDHKAMMALSREILSQTHGQTCRTSLTHLCPTRLETSHTRD